MTENGDNSYDLINLIQKGGNYGWPTLRPADVDPYLSNSSMVKPIMTFKYEIAPTEAVFYNADAYPALKGMFLVGSYNRGELFALKLDDDGKHVREAVEIKLPANLLVDPITSIAVSPTGQIYLGGHSIYKIGTLSPMTLVRQ